MSCYLWTGVVGSVVRLHLLVPVIDSCRIITSTIASVGLAHGFVTIPAQLGSISAYTQEYGRILWMLMHAVAVPQHLGEPRGFRV
jgi:hypothetical protein